MKLPVSPPTALPKTPTGIGGFDEITGGGLPRGRATVVLGGAGSGKTVFALQTLVHGARDCGEPGIFVAFEESAARIVANAASFGWDLPALQRRKLFFLDAQPAADVLPAGGFDLQGLLAALDAKVRALRPRRIVFDSVDVLLALLGDPAAERRELQRLHEWLLARHLTALITAKLDRAGAAGAFEFVQFMADCAVQLNHSVAAGVSQRALRVLKYRGSAFAENEAPFVIGTAGLQVAGFRGLEPPAAVSHARIPTGIRRLDEMLEGGYFRGSSVLVTGSPGTAKTTLSGACAEAACARGDRTLFVSFDSEPAEIVRNLASVGIRLARFVRNGRLRLDSARAIASSAEVHWLRIQALAAAHRARCLVIDPISALAKPGNETTAHSVVERLVDWAKARGITVVCTSLLGRGAAGRGHDPPDLHHRRHLDPPQLRDQCRRAQPRPDHREIARHRALQPGARTCPPPPRRDARRRFHRGRPGADGHPTLAAGTDRARRPGERARRRPAQTPRNRGRAGGTQRARRDRAPRTRTQKGRTRPPAA
jgi:circadian clock protein KaiC